jgi:hypothetical protein
MGKGREGVEKSGGAANEGYQKTKEAARETKDRVEG